MGEVFDKFLSYKKEWNQHGQNTPLIDSLLLSKARSILGGNLKVMICGGAPLSEETQIFCRDVFGIKLNLAWASTETCGSGCFMEGNDMYIGRVGIPLDGVTIRMRDWAEGGYTLQDKPYPRGEILVNSKSLASGYFKQPELSEETFITDEEGKKWWVSGDILEAHPDGTFKVIDRKKDLVKLQFGEYISLGKCEAELKGCPIVDNLCLVADSFHPFITALILPNVNEIKQLSKSLGKDDSLPLADMCKDAEIEAAALALLIKSAKRAGLMGAEIPQKIRLLPEQWTPDNGLVTAALKIRRKQVTEFYATQIKEMFS
jgi:long-chain acyl-CoA synthetase